MNTVKFGAIFIPYQCLPDLSAVDINPDDIDTFLGRGGSIPDASEQAADSFQKIVRENTGNSQAIAYVTDTRAEPNGITPGILVHVYRSEKDMTEQPDEENVLVDLLKAKGIEAHQGSHDGLLQGFFRGE